MSEKKTLTECLNEAAYDSAMKSLHETEELIKEFYDETSYQLKQVNKLILELIELNKANAELNRKLELAKNALKTLSIPYDMTFVYHPYEVAQKALKELGE